MHKDFPQFLPADAVGALRGGLLYAWTRRPDLCCYIYLQISTKDYQDCFMVELSCSRGEFPINLVAYGPDNIRNGSVRFRLPELYREEWSHESRTVPWWSIGPQTEAKDVTSRAATRAAAKKRPLVDEPLPIEQALPLVETQVRDAIGRIKRFGLPFFDQFAQSQLGKI
jgi:hypothetical protein